MLPCSSSQFSICAYTLGPLFFADEFIGDFTDTKMHPNEVEVEHN
ncbi:Protein of unknown function [Pyronema omphalodes CBS 100304]|uniref:Uncharacterized protein n=1 Tax=Pyronema omphalodes (strain CBS 100304) TaxID=1076935 RepID=U4LJV6_PYROM|nr:Protein of unknown function [Pyronema omphalodes CBS 100304]